MIPDILKLAGFGAAFILLSGCTERLSGPDGGRPEGRIIITLSPDSGREVTVKDIAGIDETSINNLYAIQFDRNGAVLSNEYFSSDNEKFNTADNTVEVSVGEETDRICFIANAGSGAIGGVSTLADLGLKCKSLTNGEASLTNDNRTVMSGVWHSGDPDFTVEMYRAIAKVDFTLLAGAGVEFALHSIRMCNVPKVMYYHRDQDRLLPSETVAAYPEINSTDDLADYTEQQVASASDRLTSIEGWTDLRYMTEGTTPHTGKLLDGTDGYSCLYYLPENARGTGSATDQRQKSAETAPAGQEEYCTYIEIKGYYKSDNLVTLTEYRIFLGENNTDDYNILRNSKMRLKNNLQPMLELESGSNDPMAYILTIILIQLANTLAGDASGDLSAWMVTKDALKTLVLQFGVGCVGGAVFGIITVWFLRRVNLNNAPLYAIMLLSVMFFSYTVTTYLSGNGYLAVYIAGIIIGNKQIPYRKDILSFFDGITWLVQIVMFVVLGLLVNPHEMMKTALVALLIGVFMIFIARPLSVFISLAPFRKITTGSKAFISWVGLRGAAPILFATYPVVAGVDGADLIFNIVFFITLLSLVLQGSSITASARMLKLNEDIPEDDNNFGVEIPEEAGKLVEITLTEESLTHGNTLKELKLPEGMLVMMIKRQDRFIVPNGSVELRAGDKLLIITESGSGS